MTKYPYRWFGGELYRTAENLEFIRIEDAREKAEHLRSQRRKVRIIKSKRGIGKQKLNIVYLSKRKGSSVWG